MTAPPLAVVAEAVGLGDQASAAGDFAAADVSVDLALADVTGGTLTAAAALPRQDLAATVVAILARQALLDPNDIDISAQLDDLGLDSLGLVEAIFALEEAFDITVPFNPQDPAAQQGFNSASVASIITEVERLIAARCG